MGMRVRLLLFPALLALASAENWPQFRGAGSSGVGAGSPAMEWNGETGKNISWEAPIPGLGHSSPVIWDDRIFLTSAVPATGDSALKLGLYGDIKPVEGEGEQSFFVYCLDRKTGKILWQQKAVSGEPRIKRHRSLRMPTPLPPRMANTWSPSLAPKGCSLTI